MVKQRLVEQRIRPSEPIPDINPSFTILQSDLIGKAQGAFSLLNAIGNWLPVIVLILLAIGVYVAKDHRRAVLGVGLGLAAGMLALGVGLLAVPHDLSQCASAGHPGPECGSLVLRHSGAVPPARTAYGTGLWSRCSPWQGSSPAARSPPYGLGRA